MTLSLSILKMNPNQRVEGLLNQERKSKRLKMLKGPIILELIHAQRMSPEGPRGQEFPLR